ncbi:MAG: hypothetical protein JWM08_3179 [Candidatus Angelobacter sp.]|nr:hypothetical protein [Candidatus Angelobacter sp.]
MRKTRPFCAGWGLVAKRLVDNTKFYPKQRRDDFVRIASVSALNATLASDFTRFYHEAAKKVHAAVEPLTDEQIWTRPYPYGNSIGNLLLHLTGNLSYYIAGEIGGSGYVRNRPLEFSDASRTPKAVLLKMFDGTIAMVAAVLQKQSEQDWSAAYTAKGFEDCGDRFTAILRCAAHISHHTGQIIYLCKELERQREA